MRTRKGGEKGRQRDREKEREVKKVKRDEERLDVTVLSTVAALWIRSFDHETLIFPHRRSNQAIKRIPDSVRDTVEVENSADQFIEVRELFERSKAEATRSILSLYQTRNCDYDNSLIENNIFNGEQIISVTKTGNRDVLRFSLVSAIDRKVN